MTVFIDGTRYPVIEKLGYQGGYNAVVVSTPGGERVAVKHAGSWRWWMANDRVLPHSRCTGQEAGASK